MNNFAGSLTPYSMEQAQNSVPLRTQDTAAGIRHAAGEFESILLNQWLEGAEATFGSVPGGDGDEDAGDEQMKSFAMQALAKGITAAGGIGLSSLVSSALAKRNPEAPTQASGIAAK